MGLSRVVAEQLLKTGFARRAVKECADLSLFKQRPSAKMLFGLACIAVSYIICWPLISALGVFAIYIRAPLLIVIGGPVIWTIAHFMCMFGMYLAGADYSRALLKYLVRIFVERNAPDKLPGRNL
ncbi:MAG: hypothetical protein ACOCY3_02985 [Desulfosalsimonas sp.]